MFSVGICFASQAAEVPEDIYTDIAKSHSHIFIGTAINKTIDSDRTYYAFNVTEYLKNPLNTSKLTLTAMGGYAVGVSPSTTFSIGQEYLVFFNEVEEDQIIGFDYYAKFLGSLSDSDIQTIREVVKITDVSDFAQDNAIGSQARDAVSDYNSIQHFIFNVALLLTAVLFIILYIRYIRK